MKKRVFTLIFALLGISSFTYAQVAYEEPTGGWNYIFNCDEFDIFEDDLEDSHLDGTWSEHSSNRWDLTAPGDPTGIVGGADQYTTNGVDYIRIQDAGRPGDFGVEDFNRKISFTHDMITNDGLEATDLFLDDGVTFAFRIKVPLDDETGGLDSIWTPNRYRASANSDNGKQPYPEEGDGYGISEGLGMVGIVQNAKGDGTSDGAIGFTLMTSYDHDTVKYIGEGLYMNQTNGIALLETPDFLKDGQVAIAESGTHNMVECVPTEWNEFWVTIIADGNIGTHTVTIWKNGDVASPETFNVTASDKDYVGGPFLFMGLLNSSDWGAMDIDYIAYALGVNDPVASTTGTFDMSAMQMKCYPNPVSGTLTIKNAPLNAPYSMINVFGQTVAKGLIQGSSMMLNTDNYEKGIYLLKVGEQVSKIQVK